MGKRIWVFSHYAKTPNMSGSTRQYDHASIIDSLGWTTKIIASSFSGANNVMLRPVTLTKRRHDIIEDGVEFTWVYTMPYTSNNWRRYLNMLSYFVTSQIRAKGDDKPDLVLGSSPHPFAALAAWVASRRFRVPFILEVRDLWPDSLTQLGLTNPLIIKPLEWLEKFLYKQADVIVALTDGIADSIKSRIPNPEIVHLIPNGVDIDNLAKENGREQLRNAHGWTDKFVVGWIGAHGPANHLDTILGAAKELAETRDDIHFVFIGGGPDKPRLVRMASHLANVEFIDPIPKSEVFPYLSAMDAGVIVHTDTAAVRGARPNKLFDYMAMELPIISDLQGECAGIIDEAQCGVTVKPMNPVDLGMAIASLSSQPGFASAWGKNGRSYLERTHDRKVVVSRLAVIMNELVQKREHI